MCNENDFDMLNLVKDHTLLSHLERKSRIPQFRMKQFLCESLSESNICPISLCNNKQQALVSSEMSEEAEMRLYNHLSLSLSLFQ